MVAGLDYVLTINFHNRLRFALRSQIKFQVCLFNDRCDGFERKNFQLAAVKMALTHKKSEKVASHKSFTPLKGHLEEENYSYDPEDQGLGCRFLQKLHQHKDKLHQVDAVSGLTETNGSVRSRSIQVAMEMQTRGIHENDIVLICSRSHCDQTVAVLATLLIGAIVAPLDPHAPPAEFKSSVISLKPTMAFCDLRVCGQLEIIIRESSEIQTCQIVVFGDRTDRLAFEKFLVQKVNSDFKATIIKDPRRRVAFIVASQGTTGPSKLVCISHYSLRLQITHCASKILQNAEKCLSFFPLSWITQVAIVCYCFEVPIIKILPGAFSERSACKLIHDLRVDHAILGTDYALKMIRHASLQDFDLSCLKTVYVGGVVTPALDIVLLRQAFHGATVLQCYGTTEMTCLIAGFSPSDYESALERPGSVGKPMPGLKIKIVNIDTRESLGPDWWGELLVAGPTMMLGYYKDIIGTNAAMEKSFFKTGDVAQYDSDGYFYLQGRVSDNILLHGVRHSPTELEELILTHPYVFEVAVIGDDKNVVACVVRKPECGLSEEQLLDYISDRIPEEKRPSKIKFLDHLPKTTVGKVKRNTLKQTLLGVVIEQSKSVVNIESNA